MESLRENRATEGKRGRITRKENLWLDTHETFPWHNEEHTLEPVNTHRCVQLHVRKSGREWRAVYMQTIRWNAGSGRILHVERPPEFFGPNVRTRAFRR
jgi:hypothetical protein